MVEMTELQLLYALHEKDQEIIGLQRKIIMQMCPLLPDHAQEVVKKLLADGKPADAIPTGGQVQRGGVG